MTTCRVCLHAESEHKPARQGRRSRQPAVCSACLLASQVIPIRDFGAEDPLGTGAEMVAAYRVPERGWVGCYHEFEPVEFKLEAVPRQRREPESEPKPAPPVGPNPFPCQECNHPESDHVPSGSRDGVVCTTCLANSTAGLKRTCPNSYHPFKPVTFNPQQVKRARREEPTETPPRRIHEHGAYPDLRLWEWVRVLTRAEVLALYGLSEAEAREPGMMGIWQLLPTNQNFVVVSADGQQFRPQTRADGSPLSDQSAWPTGTEAVLAKDGTLRLIRRR
jgi:hypothetical protein